MDRPITDWLKEIRRTELDDYDNVFLFTGDEGNGKSNTAVQVFAHLDPTPARRVEWARRACRQAREVCLEAMRDSPAFKAGLEAILKAVEALVQARVYAEKAPKLEGFDRHRIVFTQDDVYKTVDHVPKGGALLWDEADINRRKAMHGDLLDLIDTLQSNRAQNLKFGMCFPRGGSADRQVLERIRWLCHHPVKGICEVTRYWTEEKQTKDGIETTLRWKKWGRYRVGPNKGAFWDGYLKDKETHMRSTRRRKSGSRLDVEAIRPILEELKRRYDRGELGGSSS